MPQLTEVLGTVLRDLARSRVVSDIFSRDVSLEYEQDPVLSAFPVPRVEVKQAAIQLRFAINAVERRASDVTETARAKAPAHAAELANKVYDALVLKNPERERLIKIIEEAKLNLEARLPVAVRDAILLNLNDVRAALENHPDALVGVMQTAVMNLLNEHLPFKRALIKGINEQALAQDVQKMVGESVAAFVRDVTSSATPSGPESLSVDVAVSRGELADLPESVLSHISVVAEIRNYEWTDVSDEGGQPVRRLRPE